MSLIICLRNSIPGHRGVALHASSNRLIIKKYAISSEVKSSKRIKGKSLSNEVSTNFAWFLIYSWLRLKQQQMARLVFWGRGSAI